MEVFCVSTDDIRILGTTAKVDIRLSTVTKPRILSATSLDISLLPQIYFFTPVRSVQ